MSGSQATFGIAITASDQTDKGAKSAEKRLGKVPDRFGAASRKAFEENEKRVGKSGRGLIRTFSAVEKAGAKIFGGNSLTKGVAERLSGIREASAAAGEGMGEAAASGSALEGTLGAIGVVAGATVGVLAAVGYAAFKMADGWAKGAASIGRTADTLGVATKALQEWQAAGERAGVDKGASTGALGGIAQTLEDARYGRNNEALALMMRMGVKFKTGADGQIDTTAMSLDLADAIARQKNAQARRLIAGKFGISDAALPMFLQGSGQIRADMADADVHAGVLSDEDVATGKRIYRKGAIVSQMKDRAMMRAGEATSVVAEKGYDAAIAAGDYLMDGSSSGGSGGAGTFSRSVHNEFAPAARKIDHAADKYLQAADEARNGGKVYSGFSREAIGAAMAGQAKWGIPASVTLAQFGKESDFGRKPSGRNNPFGIKALPGQDATWLWTHEMKNGQLVRVRAPFRNFSSMDEAFDEHDRLLARGKPYARARAALADGGPEAFARALTGVYATDRGGPHRLPYGDDLVARMRREHLEQLDGEAPQTIPVKVDVHLHGGSRGDHVKVTAGRSSRPAVSHAFSDYVTYGGMHGG